MINLEETFKKFSDSGEYLEFSRIENPLSSRRDIAAFLLLDRLVPDGNSDIVQSASCDVLFLSTDTKRLAEVATEADVLYLYRCGVRLDADETLEMFI